jgi:hypothetical protein
MAWKLKMRWSRSSEKYRATRRSSLPKPPMRISRRAGPMGQARSSTESKLRSMKLSCSSRYSSLTQSTKRSKPSASCRPHTSRISAAMRSRPCQTRSVEPSS